jgi:hypothetical protein
VYFLNHRLQKVIRLLATGFFLLGWQSLANAKEKASPKDPAPSAKVSFFTGVTSLDFNQTFASGNNKNIHFKSFDAPNFSVLFETTISDSSYLKVNFLRFTPSSTENSSSTAVPEKTLGISTLGIDYNYLPFTTNARSYLKKFGVSGGFQFSSLPVLSRKGPSLVNADIFWDLYLKFGLVNTFSLSKTISLATSLAYVLPVNFLSEFQVSAATLIEADFLLSKQLNQSWDLGIGWQLRKHSYQVTGRVIDAITSQPFQAQQDNLYSIIYFQTGYRW